MFISRQPWNRGAPAWCRMKQYTTNPTLNEMMSLELKTQPEIPSQPRAKKRRQRKPKNPAWNPSAAPASLPKTSLNAAQDTLKISQHVRLNSIPINSATAVRGVQNVFQPLGTVSVAQGLPTTSTADFALGQTAVEQSFPRSATWHTALPRQNVTAVRGRDPIVYPSAASGGIPNPSNEYLRACLLGPLQLPRPQHLLIVIDLNGTLLHRPNRKRPSHFTMRPHAQAFLQYCVDTFKVVIWSSARPENVRTMCNTILTPEVRSRVVAIWGRDKFGLTSSDFALRVQCYKRLSRIWQDPEIAVSHPAYQEGYRWNQTNTVLIDDSREKARTEPHNLVEVPEWLGDKHEKDSILPQVHDFLNHLSMHSNVSSCLHFHPWRPTVF